MEILWKYLEILWKYFGNIWKYLEILWKYFEIFGNTLELLRKYLETFGNNLEIMWKNLEKLWKYLEISQNALQWGEIFCVQCDFYAVLQLQHAPSRCPHCYLLKRSSWPLNICTMYNVQLLCYVQCCYNWHYSAIWPTHHPPKCPSKSSRQCLLCFSMTFAFFLVSSSGFGFF